MHTAGTLGVHADVTQIAEQIARVWLARYGIVSRDWYVLERPPISWRDIYHELKRLEFRGDVQRGYFVAGLAGAQFGLPEAVEMLRAPWDDRAEPIVVLSASDPANVYALKVHGGASNHPLGRPRGAGALLFTRAGRIVMTAESKGARLRLSPDATVDDVRDAARALMTHYAPAPGTMRRKDVIVETIDGEKATKSKWAPVMRETGMTGRAGGLRF